MPNKPRYLARTIRRIPTAHGFISAGKIVLILDDDTPLNQSYRVILWHEDKHEERCFPVMKNTAHQFIRTIAAGRIT